MLPTQAELSSKIMDLVNSQKALKADENPEKAFADGLAAIILAAIKQGEIVGLTSIVTGVAGSIPVTGTATQSSKAYIK